MTLHEDGDRSAHYVKNSLTLTGVVALGTGVMIGAGIFALTGQVAQLAGAWFPLAFVAAARSSIRIATSGAPSSSPCIGESSVISEARSERRLGSC